MLKFFKPIFKYFLKNFSLGISKKESIIKRKNRNTKEFYAPEYFILFIFSSQVISSS